MKYIEVSSCDECPYRTKDFCLKSAKKITLGKFYEKYRFPKGCELSSSVTRKTKEVSEYETNLVYSAYENYHKKFPNLPAMTLTSTLVRKYSKAIIRCKDINKVFEIVAHSDFLSGRTTSWKADFDWIFRPAQKNCEWNIDKILSGKYSKQSSKVTAFVDKPRTYGGWK